MDIIVTIPKKEYDNIEKEDIFVKQNENNVIQYWSMKRKPKNFNIGDNVYFVMNGKLIGYHECIGVEDDAECEVTNRIWDGFNLVLKCPMIELEKEIPMKGFQGFRYFKNNSTFKEHYYENKI